MTLMHLWQPLAPQLPKVELAVTFECGLSVLQPLSSASLTMYSATVQNLDCANPQGLHGSSTFRADRIKHSSNRDARKLF